MSIMIPDYHLGSRFAAIARTHNAFEQLTKESKSFLYISDAKIVLYPDAQILSCDPQVLLTMDYLNDYDVVLIKSDGKLSRYYNSTSDDCVLLLSERCNSNCIMCPSPDISRRSDHNLTTQAFLELIHCIPSDIPHITITGGEPFLFGKDIFIIFAALRDTFEGTEFLLLTNGRIFANEEYANLACATLPRGTTIGIPVHGHNAATHDAITRAAGSFMQTLVGIERLLSLGMNVELRLVVSRLSAGSIDEIADLITTRISTVRYVKFIGLEMTGNAALNSNAVWIPYHSAFNVMESSIQKLICAGIDVGIYNFPLCTVHPEYWSLCAKSISGYKVRYLEACNTCHEKSACGGIFAGTLRLAGDEIHPIEDEYA